MASFIHSFAEQRMLPLRVSYGMESPPLESNRHYQMFLIKLPWFFPKKNIFGDAIWRGPYPQYCILHKMNVILMSSLRLGRITQKQTTWDLKLDRLQLRNYELPEKLNDDGSADAMEDPLVKSGRLIRDLNNCVIDILDYEYKSGPLFSPELELWDCNVAHSADIFERIPAHSLYLDVKMLLPLAILCQKCKNYWTTESDYPWVPCIFPRPPEDYYKDEEPPLKPTEKKITKLCGFSDYSFYRTIGLNAGVERHVRRPSLKVPKQLHTRGDIDLFLRGKMFPMRAPWHRMNESSVEKAQVLAPYIEMYERFVQMLDGMKVYRLGCEICFPTPIFIVGKSRNGNIVGLMSAGVFS